MSTAHGVQVNYVPPAVIATWRMRALVVGVVGLLGAVIGWIVWPEQFYRSYLIGFLWIWGASLGSLAWLMIYHLTGGNWGTVTRRIFEAGTKCFWYVALASIPMVIGMKHLFAWAGMNAEQMRNAKMNHEWLNVQMFIVRLVLYFIIWLALAWRLNRISDRQNEPDPPFLVKRLRNISGVGMVLFAGTSTLGAVDWAMSLEAPWASTIFGFIFINSQGMLALCIAIIALVALTKRAPMDAVVQTEQFHDLGKLLLATVMVWAYFFFSQYLIIWAGNIPDEVTWILKRTSGKWQFVAGLLFLFQFGVPFCMLLSRKLKRTPSLLAGLAAWLVLMRWVDLYWIVEPTWPNVHPHFHMSWMDVVIPVGLGGIWVALFLSYLAKRPLLAVYDTHVAELLEQHEH